MGQDHQVEVVPVVELLAVRSLDMAFDVELDSRWEAMGEMVGQDVNRSQEVPEGVVGNVNQKLDYLEAFSLGQAWVVEDDRLLKNDIDLPWKEGEAVVAALGVP